MRQLCGKGLVFGACFAMVLVGWYCAGDSLCASTRPEGSIVCAVVTLQEQTVDPHRVTGALLTPIYRCLSTGLLQRNLDGELVPGAAESWKVGPDGKTWEFTLRKGVTFTNGQPLIADDVKWSMERAMDPATRTTLASQWSRVYGSSEVKDDHHWILHLGNFWPVVLDRLDAGCHPLSRKEAERVGDARFQLHPVGLGPFRLLENKVGEYITFEAYPHFFMLQRVPRVAKVTMRIVPEASTRMAMLKTGEADIIEGVAGAMIDEVKGTTGLGTISTSATAILELNFCDMYPKEPHHPFKDIRVRKALTLAVDREAICRKLYFGEATPVTTLFFPTSFGIDAGLKLYAYDPEQAKRLLEEAGYGKGFETKVLTYRSSSTPLIPECCEAVAAFFSKVGVKATLEHFESGIYFQKFRMKELRGLASQSNPANAHYDAHSLCEGQFHSKGLYSYWNDPKADEMCEKQAHIVDRQERLKYLQELNRYVYEQVPRLPLISVNTVFGIGPRIGSWKLEKSNPFLVDLEYVALK